MVNQLRAAREARGISLSALARESGLARATVWKIESGRADVYTTKTMEKLAAALGVPASEIFGFEQEDGERS